MSYPYGPITSHRNPLDRYTHALREYTDEKNPKMKDLIRKKMGEYLERAEKLKDHIQSTDEKRERQAVGANGKAGAGSGGSGTK